MMNRRSRASLQGLPALARGGSSRSARRYRREHGTAIPSLPRSPRRRPRIAGARALRTFHVTAMRRPGRGIGGDAEVVPSLRLSGRWLEEYGFGVGVRVTVEAEGGRLILKSEGCFEERRVKGCSRRLDCPAMSPLPWAGSFSNFGPSMTQPAARRSLWHLDEARTPRSIQSGDRLTVLVWTD